MGIPPAHCVRGGMVRPARKVQREKMGGGVWGQLRLAVVDMRVCQKERHTLFFVPRHNEMKVVLTLTSYNGNVF